MKRIAQKLAVRAARQDVAVGVATGIVLTAVRALSLIAFIGTAAVPYGLLGWALIVECLLYVACTVGIYRRNEAAAVSLAGLYVLRFVFIWYVSGQPYPALSLLTPLIAYGLFRGIRGTAELDAMPAHISTPLANER